MGAPSIYLSREMQEQIIYLLQETFRSLKKYFPSKRKTFFSYSYVLKKKIFKILDLEECAKYFNLPKGKHSLREHDKIWEKKMQRYEMEISLFCVVIL